MSVNVKGIKFDKVIITKRGCREDGVKFSVHTFPATTQAEIESIISHPTFAGWKYGISVGVALVA